MSATTLNEDQQATLVYSYAVLALTDAKQPVTEANLEKVITATGNKVNKQLSAAFVKALTGKDVNNFLSTGGSGAAPAAAAPAAPAKEAAKPKEKEKPAPPPVEEDDGGMMDLFG